MLVIKMPNHFKTYNGFHLDIYNGTGHSVALCIMGKGGIFWTLYTRGQC